MVKSGLLDPWDPRGPKIEDQGPWKLGSRKFFFFGFFQFCEKLAFFWGPKHPNLIIFEPPQTPKTLKITPNSRGGSLGNPPLQPPVSQTCRPTLIISIFLETSMTKVYSHKILNLYPTTLTPWTLLKLSLSFLIAYGRNDIYIIYSKERFTCHFGTVFKSSCKLSCMHACSKFYI